MKSLILDILPLTPGTLDVNVDGAKDWAGLKLGIFPGDVPECTFGKTAPA